MPFPLSTLPNVAVLFTLYPVVFTVDGNDTEPSEFSIILILDNADVVGEKLISDNKPFLSTVCIVNIRGTTTEIGTYIIPGEDLVAEPLYDTAPGTPLT